MKLRIQDGNWFITLPLGVAVAAYMFLFWLPGRRADADLQRQIASKQKVIERALAEAPALKAAKTDLNEVRAFTDAWEDRAPVRGQLALLHARIRRLADRAGAVTTRFDPQPPTNYGWLRETPLAVACTGSFAQITRFLQGLEGLPESIWVEYIGLENQDTSQGTVSCEINLVIFAVNPSNSDYVDQPK